MPSFSPSRFLRISEGLCRKLDLEAAFLVGTEQLSLIQVAQPSTIASLAATEAFVKSLWPNPVGAFEFDDTQHLRAGDVQDVYASELFQLLLSVVWRLPWSSLAAACEHSMASGDAMLHSADKQFAEEALVTCVVLVSSLAALADSAALVQFPDREAVLRSLSARCTLLAHKRGAALALSSAS